MGQCFKQHHRDHHPKQNLAPLYTLHCWVVRWVLVLDWRGFKTCELVPILTEISRNKCVQDTDAVKHRKNLEIRTQSVASNSLTIDLTLETNSTQAAFRRTSLSWPCRGNWVVPGEFLKKIKKIQTLCSVQFEVSWLSLSNHICHDCPRHPNGHS